MKYEEANYMQNGRSLKIRVSEYTQQQLEDMEKKEISAALGRNVLLSYV